MGQRTLRGLWTAKGTQLAHKPCTKSAGVRACGWTATAFGGEKVPEAFGGRHSSGRSLLPDPVAPVRAPIPTVLSELGEPGGAQSLVLQSTGLDVALGPLLPHPGCCPCSCQPSSLGTSPPAATSKHTGPRAPRARPLPCQGVSDAPALFAPGPAPRVSQRPRKHRHSPLRTPSPSAHHVCCQTADTWSLSDPRPSLTAYGVTA